MQLREVIQTMEALTGKPARIHYEPPARGGVRDTFADTSRARRILGYEPRISLREGLEAEVAFLRKLYER